MRADWRESSDRPPAVGPALPSRNLTTALSTAAPGKTYEYLVLTADIFGKKSDSAARATIAIPVPVPAAPAGLRAHATAGSIEISWDEPFGPEVTGYRVYRYERGREPARIASPRPGTSAYTDNDLTHGRLYFYYLTSVGEGGAESGPSAEVGITYRP